MILLILSLINWIFLDNDLLKLGVALIIFVIAEMQRKNGNATKSVIVAQFISAFILIAYVMLVIINIIGKFSI